MAYGDQLLMRTAADKVYKFFDKRTKGSGVTLANKSAIKSIPQ